MTTRLSAIDSLNRYFDNGGAGVWHPQSGGVFRTGNNGEINVTLADQVVIKRGPEGQIIDHTIPGANHETVEQIEALARQSTNLNYFTVSDHVPQLEQTTITRTGNGIFNPDGHLVFNRLFNPSAWTTSSVTEPLSDERAVASADRFLEFLFQWLNKSGMAVKVVEKPPKGLKNNANRFPLQRGAELLFNIAKHF